MTTTEFVNMSLKKNLTSDDLAAKTRYQLIIERQKQNEALRAYAAKAEKALGL